MIEELAKDILTEEGQYKYWVKVSPLARINPEEWLGTVYKKGKASWITDECKSGFQNPEDAYEWAFSQIKKMKHESSNKK